MFGLLTSVFTETRLEQAGQRVRIKPSSVRRRIGDSKRIYGARLSFSVFGLTIVLTSPHLCHIKKPKGGDWCMIIDFSSRKEITKDGPPPCTHQSATKKPQHPSCTRPSCLHYTTKTQKLLLKTQDMATPYQHKAVSTHRSCIDKLRNTAKETPGQGEE